MTIVADIRFTRAVPRWDAVLGAYEALLVATMLTGTEKVAPWQLLSEPLVM
jgi:hypothetical protein